MSSLITTSGRAKPTLLPRGSPPAPNACIVISLPPKLKIIASLLLVSQSTKILPNKAFMLGALNNLFTSAKIFSALPWLSAVISMNLFLLNNTNQRMYNLTTVVLPKPRGKPIANCVSSCTLLEDTISSQIALNTGGNNKFSISGTARAANISMSSDAKFIISSL